MRAKRRIRDARIPFAMPQRADLDAWLPSVLEAIYGAFAIDWQFQPDGEPIDSLSAEALHLALVLAEILPDDPEVLGLAALMCLSEARRAARRTVDGPWTRLRDEPCIVPGAARAVTRCFGRVGGDRCGRCGNRRATSSAAGPRRDDRDRAIPAGLGRPRVHLLASADESEAAEHAYRRAVDLTADSGSSDT